MVGLLKAFFLKFYIYSSAGYPVSGKIIGRIYGQISIRYNPNIRSPVRIVSIDKVYIDRPGPYEVLIRRLIDKLLAKHFL